MDDQKFSIVFQMPGWLPIVCLFYRGTKCSSDDLVVGLEDIILHVVKGVRRGELGNDLDRSMASVVSV